MAEFKLSYTANEINEKLGKIDTIKTAYQYAQEGGYAGTEEEFAQKFAEMLAVENGNEVRY